MSSASSSTAAFVHPVWLNWNISRLSPLEPSVAPDAFKPPPPQAVQASAVWTSLNPGPCPPASERSEHQPLRSRPRRCLATANRIRFRYFS